jgi:hypothetical protein
VQFGDMGHLSVLGTLKAIGTREKNINFKGGFGTILTFETLSVNSVLKYVTLDGLGAYYFGDLTGAININTSSCKIDSCFIQNFQRTGLLLGKNARPIISNNNFYFNNLDIVLDPDKMRNLVNNNPLKVGLIDDAPMALNDTLTSNNLFYRMLSTVTIPENKILTINPGVKLQFPTGGIQLIIKGTLKVEGLRENEVQFVKLDYNYSASQAVPIVFDTTSQNSVMKYLLVDGLGYSNNSSTTPIILINTSSCQFLNTNIINSRGIAVQISNASSPTFTQTCFYNNTNGAILSTSGKSTFKQCNFIGNKFAIRNTNSTDHVIATHCYWGDFTGPQQSITNPTGIGDSVSATVDYSPYSTDPFDCSEAAALPLTLLNFNATLVGSYVNSSWQTTSEINTDYFSVQHSKNGINFYEIGKVKASGNSSIVKNYSFDDKAPATGVNFYRLKMADIDGSYTYSKVVSLNINIKGLLSFYPNPVKDILFVEMQSDIAEKVTLQIKDMQGKVLQQQTKQLKAGSNAFNINTSALAKGIYIFEFKGLITEFKLFIKE